MVSIQGENSEKLTPYSGSVMQTKTTLVTGLIVLVEEATLGIEAESVYMLLVQ